MAASSALFYAIDIDLTQAANAEFLRVLTGEYLGSVAPVIESKSAKASDHEDGMGIMPVQDVLRQFGLSYALESQQSQKQAQKPTPKQSSSTGAAANEKPVDANSKRHDMHCTLWYCREDVAKARVTEKKQVDHLAAEKKKVQQQGKLNDPNSFPALGGEEEQAPAQGKSENTSAAVEAEDPKTPFDEEVRSFKTKWALYEDLLVGDKQNAPVLLRLDAIYCGGTTPEVAVCAAAVTIVDPTIQALCHNRCPHLTITIGKRARPAQSNQLIEGAVEVARNADWHKLFGNAVKWVPMGEDVLVEGYIVLH